MTSVRRMTLREKIATAISGGVVLFMIVYWLIQIVGVIEMLRLAYG